VRKIVARTSLVWTDSAPFEPGRSLGESLLTPTRIYVKPILRVLAKTGGVKALAHITGGGFAENIPRILPEELGVEIDISAIAVPKVFAWLAAEGAIAEQEMLRTFNCGIGMVAIVDSGQSAEVLNAFEAAGERPVMLGRVAPADAGARVVYSGQLNL
jgi:phosphoribosylformylglycinamidine cyclo-ligase